MGDLRSLQQPEPPTSSADVNSSLARFFAEKGSTGLTAEERRRVSELLGGNSTQTVPAANVPTALTPNFSFNASVQPRASTNTSVGCLLAGSIHLSDAILQILSPAFKRAAPSSSNLAAMAAPRSGISGGLTGSQSLSSLSSLAAAASSSNAYLPSSANPRSAVSRRAASRPLYLGAGYSSQAVARRRKAQAQMNSLFNNLDSFQAATAQSESAIGTPGKRRRVGEEASSSASYTVGSPFQGSRQATLPTISQPSSTFPSPSSAPAGAPPARPPPPAQPLLFSSAPHLKAKFGTPAKPSPLRQAAGEPHNRGHVQCVANHFLIYSCLVARYAQLN
jgi:hypothetical protein